MPKTALVLIDLQQDFFSTGEGKIGSHNKGFCVPGVRVLAGHARSKKWTILHVITEHDDENTLPRRLRQKGIRLYCQSSTAGAAIIPGVFEPGDRIIRKRHFNGFYETELRQALDGYESVVIGGISADCCVNLTAFE